MADVGNAVLRQQLVKFLMVTLDNMGRKTQNASIYNEALERAALHTPKDVLQNVEQLESALLDNLTDKEIDCLILAAKSLTGAVPC